MVLWSQVQVLVGPTNSQPLLEIAGVLSFEPAFNLLVMLLSYLTNRKSRQWKSMLTSARGS